MTNNSVIALGHNENAYVFSSIGIIGKVVSEDNIEERIEEYLQKGVKIFFVSQVFREKIDEIRNHYRGNAYPIFILLVMDKNVESIGIDEIRKNVEKATGINLF